MSRGVAFVVGLLAAVGVGGGLITVGKAHFGGHKSPFHLEKARVERGDVVGRVTATGTLSALVTVQVGSQVSGRIAELYADYGSHVKRGQVIARLDARLFEAAVEQARANRTAAAGDLEKARAESENADHVFGRTTELSQKELVAKAELDTATAKSKGGKAAVEAAQGNLEQARAQYNQAQVNLGYATIVSPISGVVISRNVDVGQTVAASLQAPTLFTIAEDLGKMQVHTAVSEADVGRLAPGLGATFVVDAYPDTRFKGVIRQIRDAPQTLQNVVTYDAVIDVDNPDHRLKPGMTANVTFVYAERKGVLRIPTAALRFRPPEELLALSAGGGLPPPKAKKHKKEKDKAKGVIPTAAAAELPPGDAAGAGDGEGPAAADADVPKRSVWVLRGDRLAEVQIAIGVTDGSKVEVRSGGLAEGDVVLTDAVNKNERAEGKSKKGLF
jgi:HlyD family secretion protein